MKKTTGFCKYSFPTKIIRFCLWMWVFGIFAQNCAAADFGDQELIYTDEPIKVFDYYPAVAQGYEDIYDRFLNGKLIYKPDPNSDEGKVELRIADLEDPLNGTFDLSRCGDTGKYLSIATGYRKGKKPENARKVEIWFAPRFLIEKELDGAAAHFNPIMGNWKQEQAPVGMFWTWGSCYDLSDYDYLTNESVGNLSKIDLYENWKKSAGAAFTTLSYEHRAPSVRRCAQRGYHVSFIN